MKFYTVEQYAINNGISDTAVRKQCQAQKLDSITVSSSSNMPKLIKTNEGKELEIISFVNMKGGCSKTTSAVHLAAILSKIGFKTLLIDTDHQNHCETYFPKQDYKSNIADLLRGAPIEKCIYKIHENNLDIIPSSFDLAVLARDLKNKDWLSEHLSQIKDRYEFIIIDTAPAFDIIVSGVLGISTRIVIPLIPISQNVQGLNHVFKVFKLENIPNKNLIGILATKYMPKLVQHKTFLDELRTTHGSLLFESVIPEDAYLLNASALRQTVFDYREKGNASQALKKFAWELLLRL